MKGSGGAFSVRGARRALLACLALVASAACSLVLDVDAKQCVVDGDCARFGDAVCAPSVIKLASELCDRRACALYRCIGASPEDDIAVGCGCYGKPCCDCS